MTTSQEFREFGVAMVNYIADYLDNIRDRPVVPKVSSIRLQFSFFENLVLFREHKSNYSLQVSPGYLAPLQPTTAPQKPEHWKDVMEDIEKVARIEKLCFAIFLCFQMLFIQVIMPGVTHWHHPQFHAYFPTANSYPGIGSTINISIYHSLLSCGHAVWCNILHRFLMAGLACMYRA